MDTNGWEETTKHTKHTKGQFRTTKYTKYTKGEIRTTNGHEIHERKTQNHEWTRMDTNGWEGTTNGHERTRMAEFPPYYSKEYYI